ncbi:MAG: SDR family oxidoreductase [Leptolyngbyaceae cyanobacterium MO_188.B28]|nr:SDR family oxidoreductase [Leptolyngbyaceae cyanobacterium MO_188.B28]
MSQGGGTGIGRAVSLLLSEHGAAVAINYSHSKAEAEDTVQMINSNGGRAIAVKADVSNDGEVRSMVETVAKTFGGLDYLVNNAGITEQLRFDDLDAITREIWDKLFAVNVIGMFHCSRAVAPYMNRRNNGAIVNIGSIAGVTGFGSSLPYAVSKSAVHGLTKSLARALAPNIRVNCVAPGPVDTRWWKGNEEKMQAFAKANLLGRISTPEDIAETVLMPLASQSMTGQIILADNGQSL